MEIDFGKPIDELKEDLDGILKDFYKEYLENGETGGFATSISIDKYLDTAYTIGYVDKPEMDSNGDKYIFNADFRELQKITPIGSRIKVTKYIIDNNELEKYIYTNIES